MAELQREVEDLKLRLHMAAEHYKDKYKECQRLQKQVLRLSEQQGVGVAGWSEASGAEDVLFVFSRLFLTCPFGPQELKRSSAQEATVIPASVSPDASVPGRVAAHPTKWPPSG